MLRRFATLALVGSLIVLGSPALRATAAPQPLTATVLVTMQPGVDLWMPVSQIIPADAQGRVWHGSTPIQTHQLWWFEGRGGIRIEASRIVVRTTATAASSSFDADLELVGEPRGCLSANGWLRGPGQMIYYDRRTPEPMNAARDYCKGATMRFDRLRANGIGSIFGTLHAGTVLSEASMYLIAYGIPKPPPRQWEFSGVSRLQQSIPVGAILTSAPSAFGPQPIVDHPGGF